MAKDHSGRLWVFQDGSGSFRMAQDDGGRLRRITWRAERADLRREEAGIASFVAAGIDESAFAIVIERHEATGTHPTADRNRAGRNYPILPDDGPILPPIQDPPPTAPPTAAAAAAAAAVTPPASAVDGTDRVDRVDRVDGADGIAGTPGAPVTAGTAATGVTAPPRLRWRRDQLPRVTEICMIHPFH